MEGTRRETDPAIQGAHGYMTPFQGNRQRGRCIEEQKIYSQPFSQMMMASNTPQRTTIGHAIVTEHTNKTSISQRKPTNKYNPKITKIIIGIALEIKNNDFYGKDALVPCLFVAEKLKTISKRLHSEGTTYENLITSIIGPYHLKYLKPALDQLEYKFATESSWEYQKELNMISDNFHFCPKDPYQIHITRETIVKLYNDSVKFEFLYIEYIKNDPVLELTKRSMKFFDYILHKYSIARRYTFISKEDFYKHDIYRQTIHIVDDDLSDTQKDSIVTKQLDYLDSKKPHGFPINNNDRRMYYDLLSYKLSTIPRKNALLNRQSENDRSCLLKDLVSLCCKYNTIINNLPCLATDIKKVAQPIALRELLTIEGKKEITIQWKKEILNHILILGNLGYLDSECEAIYSRYCYPQTVMTTDRFTDYQCSLLIDEINEVLLTKRPDKYLNAARMLKELLDDNKDEIMTLVTRDIILKRTNSIKKRLYHQLFKDVFKLYKRCNLRSTMADYEIAQAMSIYHNRFIESNPYTFALKSDIIRKDWGKIGCYILYQAVFNFHKKTNLNEEDAELLLLIKNLDTDVSYHIIKICIESALIKFFQSITNNADSISIKIANELSSWVDIFKSSNPHLLSLNEEWKSMNQTQTPHCPPLAQSTSGNQASIPLILPLPAQHPTQSFCQPPQTRQPPLFQPPTTMPHAEYEQENPLSSALQHIVRKSFEPSIRLSQLQPVEYDATQISIQNVQYPPLFPPLFQNTSSQQVSFMSSVQRVIPHQYSTMDNPILLEEKQQPLKASVLYKMPKDKELHSSVPDDTLLTDPSRYDYSLLEQ